MAKEIKTNQWGDFVSLLWPVDEIDKIRARRLCEQQAKDTMAALGVTIFRIDFVEMEDHMKWHHVLNGSVCEPSDECLANPDLCYPQHWRGVEMDEPQRMLIGWKVMVEDTGTAEVPKEMIAGDEQPSEENSAVESGADVHGTDIPDVRAPDAGGPVVPDAVDGVADTVAPEEVLPEGHAGDRTVEAD